MNLLFINPVERFRTITKTYYRGAQGYILVYDITNETSFKQVKYWLNEIKKNGNESVPKIIVGNKADLDSQRLVSLEDGQNFAKEMGIPFMETSAKDDYNVESVFMSTAANFVKHMEAQE
mmetsp:Transcript_16807/g.18708  ORF Transcript_16807/g.18708 Transcript_16807/m.18708 type:complete len:120 (-) Transcript_16807:64-423(-)